jgi:hypothetical protein
MCALETVVIRRYLSEYPAQLAKTVLEGAGITATIRRDDCGGWEPPLQVSNTVQLIVRIEDAQEAENILKELEAKENRTQD